MWANALTAAMVLSLIAVHSVAQLWLIYLVAFGYGIAFTVLGSASAGLRKDLLPGADLAAANATLSSIGYGVRIVAPLAGAGPFRRIRRRRRCRAGRSHVCCCDRRAVQYQAHRVVACARARRIVRREMAAGFRHLCAVPLLWQITVVSACAFSIIGLQETIIFAVIAQGLHRPPSFLGVASSAQGAGAIAAGIVMSPSLRRITPQTVSIAAGAGRCRRGPAVPRPGRDGR